MSLPLAKDCIPSMLEVLGEHLYAKVKDFQETFRAELDVARLTGVLLELGEQNVLKFLQDEELLRQGIQKVIQHVPEVITSGAGFSLEHNVDFEEQEEPHSDIDIEEQLYNYVHKMEPALSAQITGMLLEMDVTRVEPLLRSHIQLSKAVDKAKVALSQQCLLENAPESSMVGRMKQRDETEAKCVEDSVAGFQTQTRHTGDEAAECMSNRVTLPGSSEYDNCVTDQVQEMGELIYTEAERLYPAFAAKLTGMVLDMGETQVKLLLQDTEQLHTIIHRAYTSLCKV